MGWLDSINAKKKDKIPEIFKDKSDDDILKMMDEAAKATGRVTELEAERVKDNDKVKKIETEFESVKAKLAAAEAKNVIPARSENNEEPANFVEDPDRAFAQRVTPLANITLQTAAMTARILAQQQL